LHITMLKNMGIILLKSSDTQGKSISMTE